MTEKAESIIFVVDGKRLETMSLLLAATLANAHDTKGEVDVIAYVPGPSLRDLSQATHRIYAACGVQVQELPTADAEGGVWAKPYPHGNKILACSAPRSSSRTIFLDTDVYCLGKITGLVPPEAVDLCVVPEGVPTWGKQEGAWQRAYAHFGMPVPAQRVRLTRRKQIEYPPYFNAGFVGFSDRVAAQGHRGFGSLWFETAREFDWRCPIANKRPWLDQITLPLTAARFDIPIKVLDEIYNYSVSGRQRLGKINESRIVHYHRAKYFVALPQTESLLQQVRDRTIGRDLPEVNEMLRFFTEISDGEPADPASPIEQAENGLSSL